MDPGVSSDTDGVDDVTSEDGDDDDSNHEKSDATDICVSTYAEVASIGLEQYPPIPLTKPFPGQCRRCNCAPVYRTNYSFFCEFCLRKEFFKYKNTNVRLY